MDKLIENSAACELRSVIRFLNAKNIKPVDIHRRISEVYGENAMSDSIGDGCDFSMKAEQMFMMKNELGDHL